MTARWPGEWVGHWPGDWPGEQDAGTSVDMGAVIAASGALAGTLAVASSAPATGGRSITAEHRVRYADAAALLPGRASLVGGLEFSRSVRYTDMAGVIAGAGAASGDLELAAATEARAIVRAGGAVYAQPVAGRAVEAGAVAVGSGRVDARLSIVLRAVDPPNSPGVVLADDELLAVLQALAA